MTEDMLGLFNEFVPRHVRRFAELGTAVTDAVAAYAEAVKARTFPGPENTFRPKI